MRKIDPAKEITNVEANHVFGDFGGASVVVIGAGIIPEISGKAGGKSQNQYRDPKTLQARKQFWNDYFSRSNATLDAFGAPALLTPIRKPNIDWKTTPESRVALG